MVPATESRGNGTENACAAYCQRGEQTAAYTRLPSPAVAQRSERSITYRCISLCDAESACPTHNQSGNQMPGRTMLLSTALFLEA